MSLKPIDLQSLFAKMDEVSKEQTLAKEHSTLQQSQVARLQISKELEEDRRVIESQEDGEFESIKDEDSEKRRETSRHNREENESDSGDDEGRIIVKDLEVGRHIDLTG